MDPRKANTPISRPAFFRSITLNSAYAQKVFDRVYDQIARDLYAMGITLRIVASEEQAAAVETLVNDKLSDLERDMEAERARLEQLCEGNGIHDLPDYTHPKTCQAKVSSPQAARFLGLIIKLDELVGVMDSLWLCGLIDNRHIVRQAYEWQRRFIRAGGTVRKLANQARAAAMRSGKSDTATTSAVEHTEEQTTGHLPTPEDPPLEGSPAGDPDAQAAPHLQETASDIEAE